MSSITVRTLLASGAVAVTASAGLAQTQTTTDSTGTTTTTGSSSSSGNVSGLQGALGSAPTGGEALQLDSVAGGITSGEASGARVQSSNAFGAYFANPQYQGRAGAAIGTAPGGFGTTLYQSTGATTGVGGTTRLASGNASSTANRTNTGMTGSTGTTGFGSTGLGGTSTTTGTAGRTGTTGFGTTGTGTTGFGATGRTGTTGFGTTGTGRTGTTGFGTTTGTTGGRLGTNTGEVIPVQRAVSYTAVVRIPAPVVTAPQMAADLRGVLDRSSMLTNPRNIQLAMDGNTVVLRGTVADEDEARTAEGMIRLTPGVSQVRNELRY